MTNPFILTFLQRFDCSSTHFQAIITSVNPQKSTFTKNMIASKWVQLHSKRCIKVRISGFAGTS